MYLRPLVNKILRKIFELRGIKNPYKNTAQELTVTNEKSLKIWPFF